MLIRDYKEADCAEIAVLFYNTVHKICCKHYTKQQLNAWAQSPPDEKALNEVFLKSYTVVAEGDGVITGFGNIENDYLDRLYVHKDYQNQGVGAKLTAKLESYARQQGICKITTHASITALPFFEKLGYIKQAEQSVIRHGVTLTNFVMYKNLI